VSPPLGRPEETTAEAMWELSFVSSRASDSSSLRSSVSSSSTEVSRERSLEGTTAALAANAALILLLLGLRDSCLCLCVSDLSLLFPPCLSFSLSGRCLGCLTRLCFMDCLTFRANSRRRSNPSRRRLSASVSCPFPHLGRSEPSLILSRSSNSRPESDLSAAPFPPVLELL
jgi:hypothetical protein